MKALKTIGIAICAFLAFCVVVAIFDDSDSSSENKTEPKLSEQTEQKQETKTEQKESKEVQSEQKQENSFLGTYEITDMSGYKLTLNINEDETVSGLSEYGTNYYGSWTGPTSEGIIIITFAEGNKPYLIYEGGEDNHALGVLYLRDGWIYTGGDNAHAKNPRWRLKVTKIK